MSAKPIMVVTLSVTPQRESEFNEFYHHRFLFTLAKAIPEFSCVRRYEEFGVGGTLRWYDKQFITIYEIASEDLIEKADSAFARPEVSEVVEQFQQWKSNDLWNFTRVTYKPTFEHDRKSWDGPFGSRPFFLWSHEVRPEDDEEFQRWYEQDYLPVQIADIPTWACCRRYISVKRDPVRHLTVFEAEDESVLGRCIADLRAPHRVRANLDWKKRVEKSVVWQDATSFRCIFRYPG